MPENHNRYKAIRLFFSVALAGLAEASACTLSQSLSQSVDKYEQQYAIPKGLFRALIQKESSFCVNAKSPAGAIGLGQLMPATAKSLGVNPYDPEQNLRGAAQYFAQQYQRFGSWNLALAAYNAGPGNVTKYGGVPPFTETRNYVTAVNNIHASGGAPVITTTGSRVQAAQPATSQKRWGRSRQSRR